MPWTTGTVILLSICPAGALGCAFCTVSPNWLGILIRYREPIGDGGRFIFGPSAADSARFCALRRPARKQRPTGKDNRWFRTATSISLLPSVDLTGIRKGRVIC